MPLLIALTVFVAVTAGVMALIQVRTAGSVAAQERLARISKPYDLTDWQPRAALRGNRLSSVGWLQRLLADVDFAHALQLTLVRADWNMRVSEFLATSALAGIVGFGAGYFLLGKLLLGLVLAVVLAAVPWVVLRMAAKRRIRKIQKQLVEMLVMMANSLKAGFGLMQAVDQAARQLESPIADELKQLLRDTQVGSTVEEAVVDWGKRIGSYDLEIIVTAILVQRNVGGNLSEILDNTAQTIRERERIQGEIATLTAEGKVSGVVIGALPPLIALGFFLLNRAYMMLLVTDPIGRLVLVTALVMEVIGALLIKKIISIDI